MDGCENHAGCADAALRAARFDHRLLYGVQSLAAGDALHGLNLRALDLREGDETTVDENSIDDDRARAALALAAALLRACEFQLLAQHVEQTRQRVCVKLDRFAVHGAAYRDLAAVVRADARLDLAAERLSLAAGHFAHAVANFFHVVLLQTMRLVFLQTVCALPDGLAHACSDC